MAVLAWDNVGERFYETGVDRGVLYLPTGGVYDAGYAWNGLVSVTEAPSGAEANPQYAGLFYNLACAESLAGRAADAIEQLGLAIEKSERFRSFAKGDSDFDPIRDEPGFKELVGD